MHIGPQNLKSLLARYSTFLKAPEGVVVAAFCKVLVALNIPIVKGEVKYIPYSKTIHVKSVGPKKSEIMLNREKILLQLQSELGAKDAPTSII